MFDSIAGLPLHPMVVHAAVVLIPLSAFGAILIALRPRSLRLFGVATVLGAGIGMIASFIARTSGEYLATIVGTPQPHTDYGDRFPVLATIYFLIVTIFWLFARGIPLNRNRPLWLKVFGGVVVLAAIAITYFTIITGHSGAEAVWSGVIPS
jgi:uncharacterized membrane protein